MKKRSPSDFVKHLRGNVALFSSIRNRQESDEEVFDSSLSAFSGRRVGDTGQFVHIGKLHDLMIERGHIFHK